MATLASQLARNWDYYGNKSLNMSARDFLDEVVKFTLNMGSIIPGLVSWAEEKKERAEPARCLTR